MDFDETLSVSFSNPTAKTGIVMDPLFLKHDHPNHPESATRLVAILKGLVQSGLHEALRDIPASPAEDGLLRRVHTEHLIARIRSLSLEGGGFIDADTYVNPWTEEAARTASGGLVALVNLVLSGDLHNGFALCRPPGHHATPNQAMGFCIFNHVAIAARVARDVGASRVAVVDVDAHHGNGTQAALEDDPTLLYISTHQWPLYPGTGRIEETGPYGNCLNLPLPPRTGDNGYRRLFDEIILPRLVRFSPELILVSAGFDAHWADPLTGLGLSSLGQAWIAQRLVEAAGALCKGRIVFTLEGGYHLTALASGVVNTIRALLGKTDFEDPLGPSPHPEPDLSSLLSRIHAERP